MLATIFTLCYNVWSMQRERVRGTFVATKDNLNMLRAVVLVSCREVDMGFL